jgi:hypothetical protein
MKNQESDPEVGTLAVSHVSRNARRGAPGGAMVHLVVRRVVGFRFGSAAQSCRKLLLGPGAARSGVGSFDSARVSLRGTLAPLRMTGDMKVAT